MRTSRRRLFIKQRALLIALVVVVAGAPMARGREALTLRVNDAFAEPGGLAAVVIRTYATKPISQGQVCFRARPEGLGGIQAAPMTVSGAADHVFSGLEGVKVFAKKKDALSIASLETAAGGQTIVLEFSSASTSINKSDGPLAVLYFRVSPDVSPGDEYRIEIDLANTLVFDSAGAAIRLAPRAGRLRIRHPVDPHEAEAEDDKIAPGERAELGVETFEPVAMASGQIGFTYDPAIASARPKVKMKRKHGRRKITVDRSTPGLVFVTFTSPNNSWNMVPGEILSVKLPTSRRVAVGTRSKVGIDPSLTFFMDPSGDMLPFRFEGGAIRFRKGKSGGGSDD